MRKRVRAAMAFADRRYKTRAALFEFLLLLHVAHHSKVLDFIAACC